MTISKNSIYVLLINNNGKRDAGFLTQLKYLSGCYYFTSSRDITKGNCYENGGKYYNSIEGAITHFIKNGNEDFGSTASYQIFHFWTNDATTAYHFISEYLIDGRIENSRCVELIWRNGAIYAKLDSPEAVEFL